MTTTNRLRFLAAAALALSCTLAAAGNADAGRGRFVWGRGGGRTIVRVGGHGGVTAVWSHRPWRWSGWGPRVRRHWVRGHVYVGGAVVVGGGYGYYYSEPPPPPPCEYPSVPAYYTPEVPEPCQPAVVAQAEPRFRPRLGLGVIGGHFEAENGRDGDELGVLARLQATRHFGFELELSKTDHDDGARLDRRAGAGLLLDLAPRSRLSPYLVGAVGLERTEVNSGSFTSDRSYGEVGAGLTLRLSDSFALFGDYRVGTSTAQDSAPQPIQATVYPVSPRDENYARGRLGAMLFF